eukprot:12410077-Karenia_brevis.AAC.1
MKYLPILANMFWAMRTEFLLHVFSKITIAGSSSLQYAIPLDEVFEQHFRRPGIVFTYRTKLATRWPNTDCLEPRTLEKNTRNAKDRLKDVKHAGTAKTIQNIER